MTNDDLKQLVQNSQLQSPMDVLIGDDYLCSFRSALIGPVVDPLVHTRKTYKADVSVYQHSKFHCFKHSELAISIDEDLGGLISLALYLRDKHVVLCNMVSACQFKFIEPIAKISDFIKLLKFKPKHSYDREPDESLGLSVIQFPRNKHGFEASIEYSIDGLLYYEVLDMSHYSEGTIISHDSPLRHDVISYVKLKGNEQELADKINKSLANLYDKEDKAESETT